MSTLAAQAISTSRLDLLPLHREHAEEMAAVLSDPALHSFIGGTPDTAQALRSRYQRIINVRVLRRWGPARIAGLLHLVPSTVHRVLARYGLARLAHLDRTTGRVIRRYERDRPGELVHVDIKKLGNIPDGGGPKVLGRQAGRKTRSNAGYSYLHTAVDDHSRFAYSEIHTRSSPPAGSPSSES